MENVSFLEKKKMIERISSCKISIMYYIRELETKVYSEEMKYLVHLQFK